MLYGANRIILETMRWDQIYSNVKGNTKSWYEAIWINQSAGCATFNAMGFIMFSWSVYRHPVLQNLQQFKCP